MNNKLLLPALFAALLTFAGCSGSDSSSVKVTPIDLTAPDTIVGTYAIDLFEAAASGYTFSNDCAKAADPGACTTLHLVSGTAAVSKDNESNYTLKTKTQLLSALLINNSLPDVYQYSEYEPVPAANITADGINLINGVTGVKGRNLLFTEDNPGSSFSMTYDNSTKLITNNLSLVNKVIVSLDENGNIVKCDTVASVPVIVKMRKINDVVSNLDGNALDVPGASIKENGQIFKPYEKFAAEASAPACP